ncbi:hypothetical protein [Marilutibacter alkalisoli]|nr:hypothetical protein [Lysobacter alkalisoli]
MTSIRYIAKSPALRPHGLGNGVAMRPDFGGHAEPRRDALALHD